MTSSSSPTSGDELLPCPGCGGEAGHVENPEPQCWVECKRCGLQTALFNTPQEAATAWNRRASPTQAVPSAQAAGSLINRDECAQRGHDWISNNSTGPSWCHRCGARWSGDTPEASGTAREAPSTSRDDASNAERADVSVGPQAAPQSTSSAQAGEPTPPDTVVLRKAKVLSILWTTPGMSPTSDEFMAAIEDLHKATCAAWGVDHVRGFKMTTDAPVSAPRGEEKVCAHENVDDGVVGDGGYRTICLDCGEDLTADAGLGER